MIKTEKTNVIELVPTKEEVEKIIPELKKDPTKIKDIKNPSQIVRNYAITYFRQKYEHPTKPYSFQVNSKTNSELYIMKEEITERLISELKTNPEKIKDIENPSQLVRNYAVSYFIRKYER